MIKHNLLYRIKYGTQWPDFIKISPERPQVPWQHWQSKLGHWFRVRVFKISSPKSLFILLIAYNHNQNKLISDRWLVLIFDILRWPWFWCLSISNVQFTWQSTRCGSGQFTKLLAPHFSKVVASDLSKAMLEEVTIPTNLTISNLTPSPQKQHRHNNSLLLQGKKRNLGDHVTWIEGAAEEVFDPQPQCPQQHNPQFLPSPSINTTFIIHLVTSTSYVSSIVLKVVGVAEDEVDLISICQVGKIPFRKVKTNLEFAKWKSSLKKYHFENKLRLIFAQTRN